jgi:tellurite resistance protein
MRMVKPSDPHSALIFTMVLIAAAEGDMTDGELGTIGRLVRYLPIFKDFDHDRLTDVGRDCADLLRQEDGLEQALEIITETLPRRLHETAYALACDVAVADGSLAEEELNLLEMLRARLEIDRLTAAAIERATRARHALL